MPTTKRPAILLFQILVLVAASAGASNLSIAASMEATPSATAPPSGGAPSSPPARICGNAAVLDGPASPPAGAVRVEPGQNLYFVTQAQPGGTTFWLAPGTHTLGDNPYAQIQPKDGNAYIGAPGAVLDGQGVNYYAFTTKAANVTVKHLTVRGFRAPGDEGVVNHDYGPGWVIERNTIHRNGGAGVMLGDDNRLAYNCLADNGQYGFQGFGANLTIDHNEVARNNTYDWEKQMPGCGCSGGAKFWDAGPAAVTNNWVYDNAGVALWADTNNRGFLFQGNWIEGNQAQAILYETSYNFRIVDNTMRRNGFYYGRQFAERNDPFPFPAVYISESGGDRRVAGGLYAASEVSGNVFEDNWGGVVLWENPNRFGHDDSDNTSKGFTTLAVDPTGAYQSPRMADCGPGVIDREPNLSNCRWKTQNVSVTNNDFRLDKAAVGCSNNCGLQGLFSNGGVRPSWSPYKGSLIQDAVTFGQNNRFANNRYVGDWRFVPYEPVYNPVTLDKWQANPYNQDVGSTLNGSTAATTPPPVISTPQTIWPDSQTVTEADTGVPYTLGTRFVVSVPGSVTGLRFHQTPKMQGTISLKLWRATGRTTAVQIASASYTAGRGYYGWRTVTLSTPVTVTPSERYVVTYHTPQPFAVEGAHLQRERVSGNLTANASGDPVGYGNSLYKSETGHTFPTDSSDGAAYFADVVFLADRTTGSSTTSTTSTTTPSTTSTTSPTSVPPQSLWPDSQTVTEADGGIPYTLGTRFVVSAPGTVTALRFHQTPKMQGTISLKLWRATGPTTATEMAAATYSATGGYYGWRNVTLATPVTLVPGERYVVSYHTPSPFALELDHLRSPRVSGDVTANANGDPVGYANALYKSEIGAHTFPTNNGNGHSYFADVVFRRS